MRTRMITRTVNFTTVKAMVVDTATATVENKVVTIIGEYNEKDLEKLARKELETETVKMVSIISIYKDEQIYGMTEEEFVHYANIITR